MSLEKFFEQVDDGVDPRVQIELERLNTATDEINKLEVDLDEARNHFRQLLQESTCQIDNCAKKLGTCIIKVRPYYEARIKAREALIETQKAAVNFERANSAHAAAKEMVYLAEEGLKAEGRTFDHAWQEMLNHATMRVNESESERTKSEAEHKRTSQIYQFAEIRVRTLQKELKRAITKSRPYFELKIHYNQLLEKQKMKVKNLEKQVADVKLTYAHTLKNLEQISDEIHKTRQKNKAYVKAELGKYCERVNTESDSKKVFFVAPNNISKLDHAKILNKFQNNHDAKNEFQKNKGDVSEEGSPDSDSSLTGPADTESEDEILEACEKQFYSVQMLNSESDVGRPHAQVNKSLFEGVGICSFPIETELNLKFEENHKANGDRSRADGNPSAGWTEIKLGSPEEETFSTVKLGTYNRNQLEQNSDVSYTPSTEKETRFENFINSEEETAGSIAKEFSERTKTEEGFSRTNTPIPQREVFREDSGPRSLKTTPRKSNLRRQSLDVLWNNTAGEKVKEILSNSIMKLNISSLTDRRSGDPKLNENNDSDENEGSSLNESKGNDGTYESNLTTQFGIHFFNRKNSKAEEDLVQVGCGDEKKNSQESISTQIGGFISRKEKFFTKKVPSPLEKTLNYLNADEESNSDSESLASSDMLTDDQISSLVLDKELAEIYQDII